MAVPGSSVYADSLDALLDMSLEELMQQTVTVSNRASESRWYSSSAVTIISAQQIKNSGIRTIPELMRLIPGFHVKRIDGNKWAISSRRVADRFSASMLVMMNGRTLYNPLFAGTFWDVQDTLLEDIDHIEVVRGPGSAVWGANAITGVLNIVTKNAAHTMGTLAVAGAGRGEMEYEAAAREGISVGSDSVDKGSLRVFGKTRKTDEGVYRSDSGTNNNSTNPDYLNDPDANDGIQSTSTGFRYDVQDENVQHSLQGNWYEAEANDTRRNTTGTTLTPNTVDSKGYHLLYNVKHEISADARLELITYYDYTEQFSDSFHDKRDTADIEAIYHREIQDHHVSIGASYRHIKDSTLLPGGFGFRLDPAARSDQVQGLFIQDQWEVIDNNFWLTAGTRFESNDYSGGEYNPSLRGLYQLSEDSVIWSGITRSVSTPSRSQSDACIGTPTTCVIDISSVENKPVVTYSYEVGYRHHFSSVMNFEFASFYDRENDPLSETSGVITYHNRYSGFEAEVSYRPVHHWQLGFSATYLDVRPDVRNIDVEGDSAETWSGQIHSNYQINDFLSWNVLTFFNEGQYDYASETRLDTNLVWQVNPVVELQFSLNNLLDDYHYESADRTRLNSAIRRGGMVLATFRF